MPEPQDIAALRETAEVLWPDAAGSVLGGLVKRLEGVLAEAGYSLLPISEVERGRALRAAVEALVDLGVREQWPPDEWNAGLRALLAPHVPSPLLDGGAGEGDR